MGSFTGQLSHVLFSSPLWHWSPWVLVGLAFLGFTSLTLLLGLYNYFLHPVANIRGPFLAAVSPLYLVRSVWSRRLNQDIQALHRKYGRVVRIAPNELSFSSERAMRDVHNPVVPDAFTKKGTSEDLILRLVFSSTNLLTVDDEESHKRLRSALQPAFTAKAIREQQEITQFHVQKTLDSLLAAAENPNQTVSLTHELNKYVWGNVGHLSFGEPVSEEQLAHHERSKDIHAVVAPLLEYFQYLTSMPMVGTLVRLVVAGMRTMFGFSGNILGKSQLQRRIARQDGQKNFLVAILGSKESAGLSTDEIHSNMLLLLMGGYDSSAVTLSAAFYHLLTHPEHYKRLQTELRGAFSSTDEVASGNLLQLPVLNACLKETLRLVPPFNGHGSHRIAAKDVVVDDVKVPAGTLLSTDMYTMQRDPDCWAFPEEYRPERWLNEFNGAGTPFEKDVTSTWRPFALGHRGCIGREMAMHSLRMAIATIVHACDMKMVNTDFVWDRDAGNHYMWHDYDIKVTVSKA
ncbi:sterigmatocystin biosynthesis P450 monooxygenase stcF-like protein 3 [Colletotrichum musicola]|uniref:Sterigmatocystin biosynthesis P450 monooxygenase stcF-like protein 3 n=1 Tax=Colletotrichum musicola TaxID=2175873 RepID=A0A8H6U6R8_9PEZI|nr:sterigmatocystin biosynthesis P450 monooxygenase stcF-like protein 3 [Colletotrichum musicola]